MRKSKELSIDLKEHIIDLKSDKLPGHCVLLPGSGRKGKLSPAA